MKPHPEYSSEERKLDPIWERRIADAFPRSESVSWLCVRWEKGNPWEPINRWVVWHMRHPSLIKNREGLIEELRGPAPRSTGHYCATGWCECAEKMGRWFGGAAFQIDQQQWELFQETGCYGTRWWIVQGSEGGHRHRLDRVEARIAKLMGGESDTPAPGDLPYADFDYRAYEKIVLADKVREWKQVSDWCARKSETLNAEETAAEIEANKLLWEWMGAKTKRRIETLSSAEKAAIWATQPTGLGKVSKDKRMDYEKLEESFINELH